MVKFNAKTGLDSRVNDKNYSTLGAEIERMREHRQKLKEKKTQLLENLQR